MNEKVPDMILSGLEPLIIDKNTGFVNIGYFHKQDVLDNHWLSGSLTTTITKDDSKITLLGVEDKPGVAADVFEPLSKIFLADTPV